MRVMMLDSESDVTSMEINVMKYFVRMHRKSVLTGIIALLVIIFSFLYFTAYADMPSISLNSPVSFPVDI